MTTPIPAEIAETDLDAIAGFEGRVAVFVAEDGKLDAAGRRVNRLTRGALARLIAAPAFAEMKDGELAELAFPAGMAAEAVLALRLPRRADAAAARAAGVALAKAGRAKPLLVMAGNRPRADQVLLGLTLRAYAYAEMKSKPADAPGAVTLMVSKPDELRPAADQVRALAEGVFFTRDLVNCPANVLTTTEFATRLEGLRDLGVEVEVLDEPELEKLGMRTLLAVGQGSESPSKVVVMSWNGGKKGDAPLALVGKGVVFDTGGISIKPAAGMEEMTMDMGGAGVVAGAMKSLALRKAAANVVGLVGLVENMPDGRAQRPGDVVASMKGDTVEVINTDAEGRLVLADVLWYAQDRFEPRGVIDLATLTGAIIIGLGHENAGVFSNDDALCNAFLKAAAAEGEGAWRMPLGPAYDKMLKSDIADMKNVGGRPAGSITAAQFLQRFIRDGMPWIHLDIAGVARVGSDSTYAPKGATGWGVLALNRLVDDLNGG
ncbi:MAG: leucyl aminopeptidase [Paracoccaceae bacterium]